MYGIGSDFFFSDFMKQNILTIEQVRIRPSSTYRRFSLGACFFFTLSTFPSHLSGFSQTANNLWFFFSSSLYSLFLWYLQELIADDSFLLCWHKENIKKESFHFWYYNLNKKKRKKKDLFLSLVTEIHFYFLWLYLHKTESSFWQLGNNKGQQLHFKN